jgi:hypothetical protein
VPDNATTSYSAYSGPCSNGKSWPAAFCQMNITAQDQLTTRRNIVRPPLLTVRLDGLSIDRDHSLLGTFGLCEVPTRQGFSGARSEKRSHAAVSLDAGIFLSKAKAGQPLGGPVWFRGDRLG